MSTSFVAAYGGTDELHQWNFRCVREEENKIKCAKQQMGQIPYFNQEMLRIADAYGNLAKTGKDYLENCPDDSSSYDSQKSYSEYRVTVEEVHEDDDGIMTLKDVDVLRSWSTRLTARGLFKFADEADSCIENGEKPTFWQTLVWESELK